MNSEDILRSHDSRITALEGKMSDLRISLTSVQHELKENTLTTAAVRANTEEMVNFIKGLKVLGNMAKWVSAIAGGAAVLIILVKFLQG